MVRTLPLAALLLLAGCPSASDKGDDSAQPAGTDADGDGYDAEEGDCDDGDAVIHPDALETCDEVDNDCDDEIDEEVATTWYTDADEDGFGDPDLPISACTKPEGVALLGTDCDDGDATIHPQASEVCDSVDNDCDDLIDDADDSVDLSDGLPFYQDQDEDGYGDPDASELRCDLGDGFVENSLDCDDTSSAISPEAIEVCDGVDNDCDLAIDAEDDSATGTFSAYVDADGDGYGDPDSTVTVCELGDGSTDDATDCDDGSPDINPGAPEICDHGVDDNCDGVTDDDCTACGDLKIVEYFDSFTTGLTPLDEGAALLGASVSSASSDAGFAAYYDALGDGGWDVMVVDVPGSTLPSGVGTRLSTAISAGTTVLFSYWYLGYDKTTAAVLGVSVDSSFTTPLPLSAASGSTLWDIEETLPDSIEGYTYDAGTNGEVLSPVDASTSETLAIYSGDASQEAILATFSGQVIVNGFLPWDFQTTDDDADDVDDMAELYANEIVWATGCSP